MAERVVVVDNHDSFVHTLVGYLHELGAETVMIGANAVDDADAAIAGFAGVLVSPGPGTPERAGAASGVVMGLAHRTLPLAGVQFHPEAVLTEGGYRLLGNWLERVGCPGAAARGAALSPHRRP